MLPRIQDLSPELTQLSNNRVATSTLICLGGSCGERYTGLEQRSQVLCDSAWKQAEKLISDLQQIRVSVMLGIKEKLDDNG